LHSSVAADSGLDADDRSCDCVAPPPDGFFYVGYAEGAPAPACPLGFIDPTDSIEASGDPATCSCSCNGVKDAYCNDTCQAIGASELDVQSFHANTRLDAAECSPFAGNSYPEGQITFDGAMTICCAL